MDPVGISLGLPGWAWLWVITILAFGAFGMRVWTLIGYVRKGKWENRFDKPLDRVAHMSRHVLMQPRLFNERSIGWAHLVMFWGCIIYTVFFMWHLLRGLVLFSHAASAEWGREAPFR